MKVTKTSESCYQAKMSDSEQLIIAELSHIFDMDCNDIVEAMFSYSSHMAVSRIINEINKNT